MNPDTIPMPVAIILGAALTILYLIQTWKDTRS